MNTKEIKELLKLVSDLDLKEVRIKNKEFEIKIRTDKDQSSAAIAPAAIPQVHQAVAAVPPPAPIAAPSEQDSETAEEKEAINYLEVKSPMVGTFYRSPSPDKPSYVQVGDVISKGDVVCIIEAMKLFNEIESEVSGKIVKMLIDDSSPVEYDQVLFLVDPIV